MTLCWLASLLLARLVCIFALGRSYYIQPSTAALAACSRLVFNLSIYALKTQEEADEDKIARKEKRRVRYQAEKQVVCLF